MCSLPVFKWSLRLSLLCGNATSRGENKQERINQPKWLEKNEWCRKLGQYRAFFVYCIVLCFIKRSAVVLLLSRLLYIFIFLIHQLQFAQEGTLYCTQSIMLRGKFFIHLYHLSAVVSWENLCLRDKSILYYIYFINLGSYLLHLLCSLLDQKYLNVFNSLRYNHSHKIKLLIKWLIKLMILLTTLPILDSFYLSW